MSRQRAGNRSTVEELSNPFTPHSAETVAAMLEVVDATSVEALFDIPDSVRYTDTFGIESKSEQESIREVRETLAANDDLVSFLGRGQYEQYVPSIVDSLSYRAEFITSYTQYQPEITQGFLQVLFEYQSILTELTGLEVANCSMYDAATALGEAATLSARVRDATGDIILIPDYLRSGDRSVLENYIAGTDLEVRSYPTEDGRTDPETVAERVTEDVRMVHIQNPTPAGIVETALPEIGELIGETDALLCLGSDPIALSVFEPPASLGADIVVGDASVLGLPAAYGMGLGLFACDERFLRQVPGRLVGASEDADGNRAYTLTLQTREQHIRRERATSNICTNQAWVALRAAIHATVLGASGLVELATDCLEQPEETATRLDAIPGVSAPVRTGPHFREFRARTERPAAAVVSDLAADGFAIHAVDDHQVQLCVTDANAHHVPDLVDAFEAVTA